MPDRASEGPEVGATINVHFTDMAYGGDAVGRLENAGLAVFAWPGITGETAQVEVKSKRHNLLRGQVTSVETPSPLRVEPPCPYFGTCGGCQWQHISYSGQLEARSSILISQLTRLAGVQDAASVVLPAIPSPKELGYRNTSHFAIDRETHTLGYFRRDSHSVVAVAECPISNSGINRVIPLVNEVIAQTTAEGMEGVRGIMRVWHVTIRHSEATGQTLVIMHTRPEGGAQARPQNRRNPRRAAAAVEPARPDTGPGLEPNPDANFEIPLTRREVKRTFSALARTAEAEGAIALTVVEVMEDGTINMLAATNSAAALSADAAAEAMSGSLLQEVTREALETSIPLGAWVERLGGRSYWVAPEAFFQANTGAAEALLAEILKEIPPHVNILLDVHAGVGTFGLAAANRAGRVILFESSRAAIASGHWTAVASRITNVEFMQGRAEQLITRLDPAIKPDLVILDPPRSGCQPELLAELAKREVARIIYVSCDPSTLARDIKALSPAYKLTSARVVDMFPQTFHIETLAVLDRA